MAKKFVPVMCKKQVHRLFQDDIKKIYYMSKVERPILPKFEEKVLDDEVLTRKSSICL